MGASKNLFYLFRFLHRVEVPIKLHCKIAVKVILKINIRTFVKKSGLNLFFEATCKTIARKYPVTLLPYLS